MARVWSFNVLAAIERSNDGSLIEIKLSSKAAEEVAPEPKELGQVLTELHNRPGQLRDMLGGDAAQPQQQASVSSPIIDILSSPMAKAVLAGIAAMVVKRVVGR